MTFSELIQNIIDSSKERIKNPVVGAFICSFIVCNWRPIFLLMFSDMKMEDKIYVVNEYCTVGAFLYPLSFAIIYTISVPFIMILIDKILGHAKKQRVANIYKNKTDVLQEKIKLASKVLELKDTESGNKEKQDYLEKIKYLEETNSQLVSSHKNTVDQLNASLKATNNSLEALNSKYSLTVNELEILKEVTETSQKNLEKHAENLYKTLTIEEKVAVRNMMNSNGEFQISKLDHDVLERFIEKQFLAVDNGRVIITPLGKEMFIESIFGNPKK